MTTKDILLLASGVAVGYLIFKKDLFKKKANGLGELSGGAEEIVSGAGSVVTGAVTTVTDAVQTLVNPKQAECEKRWNEYSSTIRPTSPEAMEKLKADFMSSCLLTK
jgi:X-X-X-Leu-X-X-Gly heptad repeat protein